MKSASRKKAKARKAKEARQAEEEEEDEEEDQEEDNEVDVNDEEEDDGVRGSGDEETSEQGQSCLKYRVMSLILCKQFLVCCPKKQKDRFLKWEHLQCST